jgi:hypothetical protein
MARRRRTPPSSTLDLLMDVAANHAFRELCGTGGADTPFPARNEEAATTSSTPGTGAPHAEDAALGASQQTG